MPDENPESALPNGENITMPADLERTQRQVDRYYTAIREYYSGMIADEIAADAHGGTIIRVYGLILNFGGFERPINLNEVIDDPTVTDPFSAEAPEELTISEVLTNIRNEEPEFEEVLSALIAVQQTNFGNRDHSQNWRQTMRGIILGPFSDENIAQIATDPETARTSIDIDLETIDTRVMAELVPFIAALREAFGPPKFIDPRDIGYIEQQQIVHESIQMLREGRKPPSALRDGVSEVTSALRALDKKVSNVRGVSGIARDTYVERVARSMLLKEINPDR